MGDNGDGKKIIVCFELGSCLIIIIIIIIIIIQDEIMMIYLTGMMIFLLLLLFLLLLMMKATDAILIVDRNEFIQTSLTSSSLLLLTNTATTINNNNNNNADTTTTTICRNGALVPEQAIPGAYNQVCMTLPERIIPLKYNNNNNNNRDVQHIIKIQQEASGSGRTGMAVWNSGLFLTRLLTKLEPLLLLKPKSIIELGCGTGLVSIAAYKIWGGGDGYGDNKSLSDFNVLATDGNPDVVRLAQRNIISNCGGESESETDKETNNNNKSNNIEAVLLPWGVLNAIDYSADLILGADLTYNSGSWRVLAETMSTILTPSGCVIYVSLGHEGFNVNPEMDGFLSVAKEVGGLIPVADLDGIPINEEMLLKEILTPTEAKQVQSNGGVRIAILRRKEYLKKRAIASKR